MTLKHTGLLTKSVAKMQQGGGKSSLLSDKGNHE